MSRSFFRHFPFFIYLFYFIYFIFFFIDGRKLNENLVECENEKIFLKKAKMNKGEKKYHKKKSL
jgi:hypothetical protein